MYDKNVVFCILNIFYMNECLRKTIKNLLKEINNFGHALDTSNRF